MKNTPYPGILAGLSLACLCMACSPLTRPDIQPEIESPVPTAAPAETATDPILPTASLTETATLEYLPTATLVPVTSTPQFPPVCELSVASTLAAPLCQRPVAEQSSAFCLSKKPYNLILLDPSATYEVLSEGFECVEAGMKDGQRLLMCNGPMGTSFELKACAQQACALPTPLADPSQCPPEFWYDTSQGCCAFIPQPVEQSCVLLSLHTISCVTNCAEYTSADACGQHYHACQWNDEDNICQVRR